MVPLLCAFILDHVVLGPKLENLILGALVQRFVSYQLAPCILACLRRKDGLNRNLYCCRKVSNVQVRIPLHICVDF